MSHKTIHLLSTLGGWLLAAVFLAVIIAASAAALFAGGFYGGLLWGFLRAGWRFALSHFN